MAGSDPVLVRIEPRVQAQQALLMARDTLTAKQIHDLRVTTKQIRACLRLYKPFVDEHAVRQADRLTKQIADTFAGLRDSHVQIKTLNKLLRGKPHAMLQMQPLYDLLQVGKADTLQPDLRRVAQQFEALLQCWQTDLRVEQAQWWRQGALQTYRKARKRGRHAQATQQDNDFHDWRKWVKYWLYQITFLASVDATDWVDYPQQLKQLGDDLGLFQDVCVLETTVQEHASLIEDPTLVPWLLRQLQARKQTLKVSFGVACSELFGYPRNQLLSLLETMPDA